MAKPEYESWTKAQLIARLTQLERTHPSPPPLPAHAAATAATSPPAPAAGAIKAYDVTNQPRRKIALKFCYVGDEYNGLAFQTGPTPLPTVEGTLFDALAKTRLVDGALGLEGCGWERSGRTDRGVSGAGNVVSLWVRSALRNTSEGTAPSGEEATTDGLAGKDNAGAGAPDGDDGLLGEFAALDLDAAPARAARAEPDTARELRYVHILNLVLPPSIRILAWAPVKPDFSARFSTLHRHYKYFFSPRGLDVARMQDAAARILGEHDFRNLCKIDPSKQITSFRRRILRADISPAARPNGLAGDDGLCVFDLIGTAFLYNQVRHIMAVLFLVGSGLEPPAIVDALLNADASAPVPDVPLLERRPEYQMADALPLVLWDCAYRPDDVVWQPDAPPDAAHDDAGAKSVHTQLRSALERAQIHAALDACFLAASEQYHPPPLTRTPGEDSGPSPDAARHVHLPLGGGTFRRVRTYVPLLSRNRRDAVEVINARWREGRGARKQVAGADVQQRVSHHE